MSFAPVEWNVRRTVTVGGAEDDDALDDTATVEHAVSGGDYGAHGVTAEDVDVTVTDADESSTAITLSLAPNTVPEGVGSVGRRITVTATLDAATRQVDTVVSLSVRGRTATASTDFVPVASFTLTILAGERSGTATFTLYPVDDHIDEGDETLEVTGSTSSGLALSPPSLTVTILDDDTRGVVVEPTVLRFPEGTSRAYTVVLTPEPTATVTVMVSMTGDDDISTSVVALT